MMTKLQKITALASGRGDLKQSYEITWILVFSKYIVIRKISPYFHVCYIDNFPTYEPYMCCFSYENHVVKLPVVYRNQKFFFKKKWTLNFTLWFVFQMLQAVTKFYICIKIHIPDIDATGCKLFIHVSYFIFQKLQAVTKFHTWIIFHISDATGCNKFFLYVSYFIFQLLQAVTKV